MNPVVFGGNALHDATHAYFRRINLAEIADFATSFPISQSDRVPALSNVNSNENFPIISHCLFSFAEDKLGQPERPSKKSVARAASNWKTDIRSYS
jgi:hypothetical protein